MSKPKVDTARFMGVPEFAAAAPELQAAIVALIGDAEEVPMYPSRIAYLDGIEPVVSTFPAEEAARLLAYNPPPFYTTPEAAAVGGPLT